MKKKTNLIILCIFLPLVAAGMFITGIGKVLELKTVDWRFQVRGPKPVEENVMVVVIGDESVDRDALGRWPWRRRNMAEFIHIVSDYSPRSILFDILFTEPSTDFPGDDKLLALRASQAANVFFPFFAVPEDIEGEKDRMVNMGEENKRLLDKISLGSVSDYPEADFMEAKSLALPIEELSDSAAGSGHVNAPSDRDGITRRIPLVIKYEDKILPSIAFMAALDYLGASGDDIVFRPGRDITVETSGKKIKIPLDSSQSMLVNQSGGFSPDNIPMISFLGLVYYDSLARSGEEYPGILNKIEDRIIFLGLTATGTADLKPTSFSNLFPMVCFLADGASNIIEGDFLVPASRAVNLLLIMALGLAGALITVKLKAVPSAALNLVLVGVYLFLCMFFFANNYVISVFYPFLSVFFSYTGITIYTFTGEEHEKKIIRNMFQRYVSSQVVDSLLQHPESVKLGGERRYLTIFFSDIRGFTTMSENLQPEEVVQLLNEYLTEMIKIIFKYNGTLDKFMGDAIMAIWGAPAGQDRHAELALRAAVEMRESLCRLQEKWEKEGKKSISVGMGINTGDVVVGNMGSEQFADYTVIGDNVNLAARLEENAGAGQILMAEETYNIVKNIVKAKKLKPLKVKGKEKPVEVYEIIDLKK